MALRSTSLSDYPSPYHGQRMSEAEYLALPDEKPYLEYVDGVVQQKPMPDRSHSRLVVELIYHIASYIRLHGGEAGTERRARLFPQGDYRLSDVEYTQPGAPDDEEAVATLAIEVRSRGETMAAQRRKCESFLLAGVKECWLVDPVSRSVEILGAERRTLDEGEVLRSHLMPGFELSLAALFKVLDR